MRAIGFYFDKLENSGYMEWFRFFKKNANRDTFIITDSVLPNSIADSSAIVNTNEISRYCEYILIVPFKKSCLPVIKALSPFMTVGFEEFSDTRFSYYEYLKKELNQYISKINLIFDYECDIYNIEEACKQIGKFEKTMEKNR